MNIGKAFDDKNQDLAIFSTKITRTIVVSLDALTVCNQYSIRPNGWVKMFNLLHYSTIKG